MRGATVIFQDPFGEEEVTEEGCDQEVGSVQAGKDFAGESCPGDGIGDGRKDPVEFPERGTTVFEITGKLYDHVGGDVIRKMMVHEEVTKGDIYWGGKA